MEENTYIRPVTVQLPESIALNNDSCIVSNIRKDFYLSTLSSKLALRDNCDEQRHNKKRMDKADTDMLWRYIRTHRHLFHLYVRRP